MMNAILLAAQQQQSMTPMLLMMAAIFAVMYFLMIRPQQKRQKEIRNFQNSLTEGSPVVIGGGIHGTVKRIDTANNIVEVEVARGTVIRVDRNFIYASVASQMQAMGK